MHCIVFLLAEVGIGKCWPSSCEWQVDCKRESVWKLHTWFSANGDMGLLNAMKLLPSFLPNYMDQLMCAHGSARVGVLYASPSGPCEYVSTDQPGGGFEFVPDSALHNYVFSD
jgi:hypothetical protein